MSRLNLIKMFGNENADVFNKCSKAYEQGRADAIDKFINKVVGLRIYDNDLNLLDLKMVAEQLKEEE